MDDGIDCYVVPQATGTGRNIFQGGSPLQESLPLLGVQLVLIVAITRVLYFLLKPFKQPRVVSEIMARRPHTFSYRCIIFQAFGANKPVET